MRLTNKVAIVTGAAQGIGRACAERFADEGARVVIADVDDEKGPAVATEINTNHEAHGRVAAYVPCDVGDKAQVDAMVEAAAEQFGRLDICVANAGIIHTAEFLDLEEADFDRVLRVNLKGVFLTGQAAARQMVAAETRGCIINMSSVNAVLAIPDQVPYATAKGGVNQLTKVMALGLAPYGIRVNAIGPGSIRTDMLKVVMSDEAARQRSLSRTPMGRCGEVEEVAAVATFLASDDASYITGQTIYADGGRLPLNYTVPAAD
jgi:NAD(P)-dependent dehydrogenase (short-subunit alcohol dehydrogenase family)